jgi:hypothetical protein
LKTFSVKSLLMITCIFTVNINFIYLSLGVQNVNILNYYPFSLTPQPNLSQDSSVFCKSVDTWQPSWTIPVPLTSHHMQAYVQSEG